MYRDLGRARTLQKAAESLTPPRAAGHIRNVAYANEWTRRADAWDKEQDRLWVLDQSVARREMAQRHARVAAAVQSKVIEAIRNLKPKDLTPNELARLLEVSTKLERQSRGEPTETIAHTGKDGGPILFDELTDEERAARAAEIAAELRHRGLLGAGDG